MADLVNRGRHPVDPTGERFGDTHWPLSTYQYSDPIMQVAINRATMTFIGLGEYRVLWDKAISEAESPAIVIGDAQANRTYSAFTDLELKLLYSNTTGFKHEGFDYNALLQSCRALGLKLEPLPNPPGMGRSSYTPTGNAPTERAKPAVAKEVRAPQSPSTRPKSGTATGRVWDIGDEVAASMPGAAAATIRSEVVRRAVDEGINKATVQVQYSKWKASTNLS